MLSAATGNSATMRQTADSLKILMSFNTYRKNIWRVSNSVSACKKLNYYLKMATFVHNYSLDTRSLIQLAEYWTRICFSITGDVTNDAHRLRLQNSHLLNQQEENTLCELNRDFLFMLSFYRHSAAFCDYKTESVLSRQPLRGWTHNFFPETKKRQIYLH